MNVPRSETSPSTARLGCLDIFRGFCIASMLLVNHQGSEKVAYAPLRHAEWAGWTFADTIFPAFLWIIGVTLTLSTARRIERGENRGRLTSHAAQRAGLLLLCGLFIEGFSRFDLATWQVTGVLQKIAIAYLLACLISLRTTWRGQILWLLGIFAAYLGLMQFYPVPGCGPGSWTMECNFARYLDDIVLAGHTWPTASHNDPDGILNTVSATTTVLLGILAGGWMLRSSSAKSRAITLLGSGLALGCVGALLARWIPVQKILWTPSYSIAMAGLSSMALGACYWTVEQPRVARWLKPLEMFGVNAIAAYIVSRLGLGLLKVHVMGKSIYADLLQPIASPANASLLFAFLNVLAVFAVIWWMHHRKIFVKF